MKAASRAHRRLLFSLAATVLFFLSLTARAATYHVWTNSTTSGPGTAWSNAFHTIQAAADVATNAGDVVLVTNGTYMPVSEIIVTGGVTVASVGGRDVTIVDGQDSHRCFNLGNNACTISGFTIRNGLASYHAGGGIYCHGTEPVITNCTISGSYATFEGGGVYRGTLGNCTLSNNAAGSGVMTGTGGGSAWSVLNNCTLSSNTAISDPPDYGSMGGGAAFCTLNNCTLSGNSADIGGGSYLGTLNDCVLTGNSAGSSGGSSGGTLNNCTLSGNSAQSGGGSGSGVLVNCTLTGNRAQSGGGGSSSGDLRNCVLSGNSADEGGGSRNSVMVNCTVVDNTASDTGGGVDLGTLTNCIVYGNIATNLGDDIDGATAVYSCSPDLTHSVGGNITNDPQFVDATNGNYRLSVGSPCFEAGTNQAWMAGAKDLDGRDRVMGAFVDMGAFEVHCYSITASHEGHGSVNPSGVVYVIPSQDVAFAISPELYYHVENVTTNGVSVGAVTNFAWYNVVADGLFHASFAENLAAHETPQWWLAQYGWTNDFDTAALADHSGDGLAAWQAYRLQTEYVTPTSQHDVAAMELYTSNTIMDLDMGTLMLQMTNGTVYLDLQLKRTDDLDGGSWSNAGDAVHWERPASDGKAFFRVHGGE